MDDAKSPGVAVAHGSDPVRWWVFDGVTTPVRLDDVPHKADPYWEARYENDCEKGKRTSRLVERPEGFARQLPWLRGAGVYWSKTLGYPVEDDPTLHGGGLHVTESGGWLSPHLDYDLHPHLPGKRRALNLIAFLNSEWRKEWGGALVLCDPMGAVVKRVYPAPGRLVAFEVGDLSYHGVEPVTGPVERVTAAVYYLSEANASNTRKRALFLPKRA